MHHIGAKAALADVSSGPGHGEFKGHSAHSAHSVPELRRTSYLSTFGFRKEGVCSGYQLRYEDSSLVINVLTLISKRVEEGRSVDLSELMERILSDVKRLVAEASQRHDVGSSPVVAGRIRMRPGSTVTIAPAASSSG